MSMRQVISAICFQNVFSHSVPAMSVGATRLWKSCDIRCKPDMSAESQRSSKIISSMSGGNLVTEAGSTCSDRGLHGGKILA